MYCVNCGSQISPQSNFCGNCGTAVNSSVTEARKSKIDWSDSADFEAVVNSSEVQGLIDRATGMHPKGMSAEQFLKTAKPLLAAVGVNNVPFEFIMDVVPGIYSQLGVNTGKTGKFVFHAPIGRVIASLLCSFAGRNQPLNGGNQAGDGCVIRAEIPSSAFVFGGQIIAVVARTENGTEVEIATHVPGQVFDWGTSKRIIKNIAADVQKYLNWQGL